MPGRRHRHPTMRRSQLTGVPRERSSAHLPAVHGHLWRKGVLVSSAGFVHLHTHSEYSDFDGLSSVRRLVDAASADGQGADRKSTRLNSSHVSISYAVFCLKKKYTEDKASWQQVVRTSERHKSKQTMKMMI